MGLKDIAFLRVLIKQVLLPGSQDLLLKNQF